MLLYIETVSLACIQTAAFYPVLHVRAYTPHVMATLVSFLLHCSPFFDSSDIFKNIRVRTEK